MLVLCLDTSSAAVTAAVVSVSSELDVRSERVAVDARAHGELLAPFVRSCLVDAGAQPGDLGAVVAGVGPGPFTGLRVGLVTAAVLADSLGIPAYGVCSLDGIAGAVEAPSLLVAADARRHEVYWARYHDRVRVAGPDVARPADVATGGLAAMTGAGARLYAEVLGLPLLHVDFPSPRALVAVAAERIRAGAPGETLTPLYLRRPDAVQPPAPRAMS